MTWTMLWVAAVVALAIVAAFAFRRVERLADGTKHLDVLQGQLRAIDARLASLVGALTGRLDDVRRGAADPREVEPEVEAALEALRTLAADGRAVTAPEPLTARIAQLVWELDRAVRAADMAGHGVATLARGRNVVGTEAQVALKRGTLGLRHAREAVGTIVAGIAALTPTEVRTMPAQPRGAAVGLLTPPPDEDWMSGAEDSISGAKDSPTA